MTRCSFWQCYLALALSWCFSASSWGCMAEIGEIDMAKHNEGLAQGNSLTGKLGGWSAGATINNPGAIAAGIAAAQGQTSLSLQCQLSPPGVYTVEFEIGPSTNTSNGPGDNKPEAVIEWATNGATVRRRISVINGAAISGPAEYVKVTITDASVSNDAAPYAATITVTPGTRGSEVMQPTLQNEDAVSLPGAGSVTFNVPQDAGVNGFRVFVWDVSATFDPDLIIVTQNKSSGVIMGYQNPNVEGWVHLAPGATSVSVDSLLGTHDTTVYIQWSIEG